MADHVNNIHAGHRSRLRRRFLDGGLDGFDDHQVLELILFYSLLRGDTNALAHTLLERYGSLSGVFDADPRDLIKTVGIGEVAATLLSLIPSLTRRYQMDVGAGRKARLNSTRKVQDYIVPLMAGRIDEIFYVVNLDARLRVIASSIVGQGTVNQTHVEPRHVVESALRHYAHAVVLAHNHPSGRAKSSKEDYRLTQKLVDALSLIGIRVLDHIIVAGTESFSFADSGELPTPSVRSETMS